MPEIKCYWLEYNIIENVATPKQSFKKEQELKELLKSPWEFCTAEMSRLQYKREEEKWADSCGIITIYIGHNKKETQE